MMFSRMSSPPAECCWSKCNDTFMHAPLCWAVNSWVTQWQQSFQYPKILVITYTALCPMPSCAMISLCFIQCCTLLTPMQELP
jgi:hypothetical protein